MTGRIIAAVVAVAQVTMLVGLGGCARQAAPTTKPQVTAAVPEPQLPSQADVRGEFRALQNQVNAYYVAINQLPGPDEQTHRRVMAQAFGELEGILRTLIGPNPSGAFRQQLQIIEASRQQLAAPSAPQLVVDPAVDAGLRAVQKVLVAVAERDFPNQPAISESLARLQTSLDDLDRVRGPLHREVAKQAAEHVGSILVAMTKIKEERLPPAPAAEPAAMPATAAATAPAQ